MVVVQRDCPARLVPAGTRITLPKDTFVTLTQALGGTYTVSVMITVTVPAPMATS